MRYTSVMTTHKPRGIRMNAELWEMVKADAERRGISANHYIESAVRRELQKSPRLCFYCGEPADSEEHANVTSAYRDDVSMEDLISDLAATGDVRPQHFTPATLTVTVCREHERSLGEVLIRKFGSSSGWVLSRSVDYPRANENPAVIERMSRMLPSGGQRGREDSAGPSV